MASGKITRTPSPTISRILDKTVSSGTSDFSSANYLPSDIAVLQLSIYGSTIRSSNMFMLQDVFDGKNMQVNLAIAGSGTTYQGELVKKDSATFTLKMNAKDDAWVGATRLCIYRVTHV